jgi:hypothetical protein
VQPGLPGRHRSGSGCRAASRERPLLLTHDDYGTADDRYKSSETRWVTTATEIRPSDDASRRPILAAASTYDIGASAVDLSWDDYIRAVIRIDRPGRTLWIKPARLRRSHDEVFPDSAGRTVYVITADNPAGKVVPDDTNASARQRLTVRLHELGATYLVAAGGNADWTHVEPSFAVMGMTKDDARTLGREFGQEAIFGLSPTALTVISCDSAKEDVTGWDVLPDPTAQNVEEIPEQQADNEGPSWRSPGA